MPSKSSNLDAAALAEQVRAARLPDPAERKRIRNAAGVSLREAAAVVPTSPDVLRRWEAGTVTPRRVNAVRYAALLDELSRAVA